MKRLNISKEGIYSKNKSKVNFKGTLQEFKKNKYSYLFLLPAVIYTLVFSYFTIPYMVIAFQKFNYTLGIKSPWVGLDNFKFFFNSTRAWTVTKNTLVLNLSYLVVGTVIAIVLAILINEIKKRNFAKTMQSVMLFPYFLSWVIISYILYAFLSSEYGLLNKVIEMFGGKTINWYNNADYWPVILIIMHSLKSAGYNSIIYLAAITGIDDGIYEAAIIDGASTWKRIYHITMPLLMPTVCILTLLAIGRLFYGDFAMYYSIIKDNGVLLETTDVIDTYVFRMLRTTGNPSMAMAIGVYQSIMGFVMVFGSNFITKKFFPEGALF